MGEVYRARDTRLKRAVAIKVLPAEFAADPERLARFRREAELLATLNHANIAGVYGLEEIDGGIAIAMELVDGESLDARLKASRSEGRMEREGFSRALPGAEALQIARQIGDALEAAHDKGIVHRDLKPGNIMLTHEGQVKVLDFGPAKATGPAEAGHYNPNMAQGGPNVAQGFSPAGLTQSPTLTFAGTQSV
jgi:eukaryotic-like serine/threonine-protein kinase